MSTIETPKVESQEVVDCPSYEAPRIESILTPEALEREVHYAGVVPASNAAL